MVKSMTGYGRACETIDGLTVTVEIKSVNHRYLEFTAKTGRQYSFLEDKLKTFFQQYIARGKVDVFVQIESERTDDVIVQVNRSIVDGYLNALNAIADEYGIGKIDNTECLLRVPDAFAVRKAPANEEMIWNAVSTVAEKAVAAFIAAREKEGAKMKADVLSRAQIILDDVAYIEKRSPETVVAYNEKLKAHIRALIGDAEIDEQRILTEAAVFADKIAVAEETVRLRSHIDALHAYFEAEKPIGSDLNFLIQEINREANTIGSKCSDLDITRKVIEIKGEIEKIREQIQNIE